MQGSKIITNQFQNSIDPILKLHSCKTSRHILISSSSNTSSHGALTKKNQQSSICTYQPFMSKKQCFYPTYKIRPLQNMTTYHFSPLDTYCNGVWTRYVHGLQNCHQTISNVKDHIRKFLNLGHVLQRCLDPICARATT